MLVIKCWLVQERYLLEGTNTSPLGTNGTPLRSKSLGKPQGKASLSMVSILMGSAEACFLLLFTSERWFAGWLLSIVCSLCVGSC